MAVTTQALVGREPELARLRALAETVAAGGSGALVLAGAPGVGKSALLDQLAAEAAGPRVLRASGIEAESDLPFAALDALLRPVLDRRSVLPPV
ncbi:MAG TPA: ATP-binding protein, partial [Solirubrobacteraceae bacterium]|nr:ATP-binding protein [Solirubrobacteraceae bacterium]